MIEFYPEIRLAHIGAASASGALFLLRGLALLARRRWAGSMALRMLGYAIDTVLLTAALMLMTVTAQYPFAQGWLTVKLILLTVYLALGAIAFADGRSRAVRLVCWLAGLAIFGYIVEVARTRHPLGPLAGLIAA